MASTVLVSEHKTEMKVFRELHRRLAGSFFILTRSFVCLGRGVVTKQFLSLTLHSL